MTAPKPYELRRLAADPSCPQHARDALSAAADELGRLRRELVAALTRVHEYEAAVESLAEQLTVATDRLYEIETNNNEGGQ